MGVIVNTIKSTSLISKVRKDDLALGIMKSKPTGLKKSDFEQSSIMNERENMLGGILDGK